MAKTIKQRIEALESDTKPKDKIRVFLVDGDKVYFNGVVMALDEYRKKYPPKPGRIIIDPESVQANG